MPLIQAPTTEHRPQRSWVPWVIGLLAVLWRLYYVTHVVVYQPVNLPGAVGDPAQYYHYAWNLVHRGVFSMEAPTAASASSDSFRDPGYAWLLAGWMKVFADWPRWYAAVIFTQAILSGICVLLMLDLAKKWLSSAWLIAAGMLMVVWPHSVAMAATLMSETLYSFCAALCLWAITRLHRRHGVLAAAGCGLVAAAAAYCNSVFLPFLLLAPIWAHLTQRVSRTQLLTALATGLLVLSPWWVRNATIPKTDDTSHLRLAMNLVQGSWPLYHAADRAALYLHDPGATRTMAMINHEISIMNAATSQGLAAMGKRMALAPWNYFLWYVSKPAYLWGWSIQNGAGDIYMCVTYHSPYDQSPPWRMVAAICSAINGVLFYLAVLGCVLAGCWWRHPLVKNAGAAALLLVLITATYTVLQAEPRYNIPYRNIEILLAMFALSVLFGALRRWYVYKRSG